MSRTSRTSRLPELPPPLRTITTIPAVRRARSLRIRALLVVLAVVFLPFVFVTAATGFDTDAGELLRLTIAVIPVALLLGWWLGWRMVRPVEELRTQVLERTLGAADSGDLDLDRDDEFGSLAAAFNDLLRQLDDRNRANEAFAADMAHEFKNPVAAIRACAESLSSGPIDERRAARIAGILVRSSARLDALVTQLLELARAEAGMKDADWSEVDVGALACGVMEAAADDERFAGVAFSCRVSDEAIVVGVPGSLETAMRNLVLNAASYNAPSRAAAYQSATAPTEVGGEVAVDVHCDNERVFIDVSDTGPGISAADLPHVFDRFFTTRAEKKGTGLGLAMVKAVANAHRGDVKVTSDPGVLTRFRITLWRARGASREAS